MPTEAATETGEGGIFVMLTLVVLAAWLADVLRRLRRGAQAPQLTASWADVGWLGLLCSIAASSVSAMHTGAARPAISGFWEWTGLGVAFLMVRQLLQTQRETRALVAVMVATAVAISGIGLFQFFVSMPETRVLYSQNPDRMLRQAGIETSPDSPQRMLFENRLASTEPTATFALANSLAGFLAAWLLVIFGAALASPGGRSRLILIACGLFVGFCLVLTKSRSAYVATALGAAVQLAIERFGGRHSKGRTGLIVATGCALLAAALAVSVWLGALDKQFLTEAGKSFGYRWQYWQSSLAMIADHPWIGVGPGNFQDEYTRYKLPAASEVVSDPHNAVLEIWAMAGTPALAALMAILVAVAWDVLRRRPMLKMPDTSTELAGARDAAPFIEWGLPGGFALAYLGGQTAAVGLPVASCVGGLLLAIVCLGAMRGWLSSGRLPRSVPAVAAGALFINLLAAGGIGMPGVAVSLWLLVSVALGSDFFPPCKEGLAEDGGRRAEGGSHANTVHGPRSTVHALAEGGSPANTVHGPRSTVHGPRSSVHGPRSSVHVLTVVAGLGGALILLASCALTAYIPVTQSRTALFRAASATNARIAQRHLEVALSADPLSGEPAKQLALLWLRNLRAEPTIANFRRWKGYADRVIMVRPHSSQAWRHAGEGYWEAYRWGMGRSMLRQSIDAYRRAVALYPNQATLRGRLALALAASGNDSAAKAQRRRAQELDALTPHLDQKLSTQLRRELLRI